MTNINIGSAPNDGTGDVLRTAFTTVNDNFIEVVTSIGIIEDQQDEILSDIVDIFNTLDNNETRIAILETWKTQVDIALGDKVSKTVFNSTIANLNLTIESLNARILALENNP